MSKIIRTVRGEILPENLGFTDMHEHTICDMTSLVEAQACYRDMIPPQALVLCQENLAFLRTGTGLFSDDCHTVDDVEWLTKELAYFKSAVGGKTVVDASPIGMRGNVERIREASEAADVNVIVGTGFYYQMGRPEEYRNLTEQQIYEICKKEVTEGIGDTGIYPGFLKCGMSSAGAGSEIPECELATLRALAKLAKETGLSLHVHTAVPMTADQIIDVADICLKEIGLSPDRLYMMHLDQYLRVPLDIDQYIRDFARPRTVNIELQCRLLERGCTIGFDSWDSLVSTLPDNYDRLKALVELLRRGYADQIVLGHDITDKSHGVSCGYTGFTGFTVNGLHKLYSMPDLVKVEDVHKLVYENPARLLAFDSDNL